MAVFVIKMWRKTITTCQLRLVEPGMGGGVHVPEACFWAVDNRKARGVSSPAPSLQGAGAATGGETPVGS